MGTIRIVALLAVAAQPALAQIIDLREADGEMRALAEATFADALSEARRAGAPVSFSGGHADLNGDGRPEVIAQISSGFFCGAGVGCPFAIFRREANGSFTPIATKGADAIEILPSSSGGWRDLSLILQIGAFGMSWDGASYR
jgi:type II secretory pathway pseudopilin PulG